MSAGGRSGTLFLLDPPVESAAQPRAASRLRFGGEDEQGFGACVRSLIDEFARWVDRHGVGADPQDAEILLDWRFRYGDGALDVWTVPDVAEFLMDWCPRKLSVSEQDCQGLPSSVAAFVDFLTHTGQLAAPSDPPSVIRRWCEEQKPRFVRAMGNQANFGLAKSFFAQAGGPDAGPGLSADDLDEMLEHAGELGPAAVGAVLDRVARQAAGVATETAPVRLPTEEQRRAAVDASPIMGRLRGLASFCAAPGAALTAKGNLRLADARHLVEFLGTGDVAPVGLRSAEDLPGLNRLVAVALAAGVVRCRRGRLLAVARFRELDDLAAYEKVVRAAIGLRPPAVWLFPVLGEVRDFAFASVPVLLAELLDAGSGGVEDLDLEDLLGALTAARFPGPAQLAGLFMPGTAERILDNLVDLGMVDVQPAEVPCTECDAQHRRLTLTAAGLPPAVELAREAGITVPVRPDPAAAAAADIADLVECLDIDDWREDARSWFLAQPDPARAARELLDAVGTPDRGTIPVMLVIDDVADLAGGGADAEGAVRVLLGGAHDGIALLWLLGRDAMDPAEIDPGRMIRALIDLLAAALDAGGQDELATVFSGLGPVERSELLDGVWRMDHPRLAEVLDVLGTGKTDKDMAKRARRCAVKLRSRLGQAAAAGR